MKTIDRQTLVSRLKSENRPTLVEALPEKYFQQWHLPGAIQIDHDRVKSLAEQRLPDKDAEIVIYCASETCRNSHQAAYQLTALGYRDVAVYPGGKADWEAASLPVEEPT